ncbi:hypothetical protein C5S32_06910 [ANME-1 cluster archaeon GoMg1]|nr:hypothetical protein [ANME-1 cluster archaeon GoMg1]
MEKKQKGKGFIIRICDVRGYIYILTASMEKRDKYHDKNSIKIPSFRLKINQCNLC